MIPMYDNYMPLNTSLENIYPSILCSTGSRLQKSRQRDRSKPGNIVSFTSVMGTIQMNVGISRTL